MVEIQKSDGEIVELTGNTVLVVNSECMLTPGGVRRGVQGDEITDFRVDSDGTTYAKVTSERRGGKEFFIENFARHVEEALYKGQIQVKNN